MNRCSDEGLFEQTVHLINDFKEYFLSHGEPVGENPSPGNKAGGISTPVSYTHLDVYKRQG